jgi:hypothetical protein
MVGCQAKPAGKEGYYNSIVRPYAIYAVAVGNDKIEETSDVSLRKF